MAVVTDSLGRRWNSALHPRDRKGRFIRTFRLVRLFDVGMSQPWGVGKVSRINDENSIDINVTALNQRNPSNHTVGEHVNAKAENLESVNEHASIAEARAAARTPGPDGSPNTPTAASREAILPTKEDVTATGSALGFSDEEINAAHGVIDGDNESATGKYLVGLAAFRRSRSGFEGDPRAQDRGRTGNDASRQRFIETLDELGVDPGVTDDTPDGLSGLKVLLDAHNSDRTDPLPGGFEEVLPTDVDRQFERRGGTTLDRRGFAIRPAQRIRTENRQGPEEQGAGYRWNPRNGWEIIQGSSDSSVAEILSDDPQAARRQRGQESEGYVDIEGPGNPGARIEDARAPEPKDMTDEQLDAAIEDLELRLQDHTQGTHARAIQEERLQVAEQERENRDRQREQDQQAEITPETAPQRPNVGDEFEIAPGQPITVTEVADVPGGFRVEGRGRDQDPDDPSVMTRTFINDPNAAEAQTPEATPNAPEPDAPAPADLRETIDRLPAGEGQSADVGDGWRVESDFVDENENIGYNFVSPDGKKYPVEDAYADADESGPTSSPATNEDLVEQLNSAKAANELDSRTVADPAPEAGAPDLEAMTNEEFQAYFDGLGEKYNNPDTPDDERRDMYPELQRAYRENGRRLFGGPEGLHPYDADEQNRQQAEEAAPAAPDNSNLPIQPDGWPEGWQVVEYQQYHPAADGNEAYTAYNRSEAIAPDGTVYHFNKEFDDPQAVRDRIVAEHEAGGGERTSPATPATPPAGQSDAEIHAEVNATPPNTSPRTLIPITPTVPDPRTPDGSLARPQRGGNRDAIRDAMGMPRDGATEPVRWQDLHDAELDDRIGVLEDLNETFPNDRIAARLDEARAERDRRADNAPVQEQAAEDPQIVRDPGAMSDAEIFQELEALQTEGEREGVGDDRFREIVNRQSDLLDEQDRRREPQGNVPADEQGGAPEQRTPLPDVGNPPESLTDEEIDAEIAELENSINDREDGPQRDLDIRRQRQLQEEQNNRHSASGAGDPDVSAMSDEELQQHMDRLEQTSPMSGTERAELDRQFRAAADEFDSRNGITPDANAEPTQPLPDSRGPYSNLTDEQLQASIDGLTGVIDTLPEGETRDNIIAEQRKFQEEQNNRHEASGAGDPAVESMTDEQLTDHLARLDAFQPVSETESNTVQRQRDAAQAEANRRNANPNPDTAPGEQPVATLPPEIPGDNAVQEVSWSPEDVQAAQDALARLGNLDQNSSPEEQVDAAAEAIESLAHIEASSPDEATRIVGETRRQQDANNFREFTPRDSPSDPSNLVEGQNPSDTSLLRYMVDGQSHYRWGERGLDRGRRMRGPAFTTDGRRNSRGNRLTQPETGDEVYYIKNGRVYYGRITAMPTHSQPRVEFIAQDGQLHRPHVDGVFFNHGIEVDADGQNATLHAPEGHTLNEELMHFIDSFAQTDNSGNFRFLRPGVKYRLSTGHTIEGGRGSGLILKDPDGNVLSRNFRVRGGIDNQHRRFFENAPALVTSLESTINTDNERRGQVPTDTPAPTPDVPQGASTTRTPGTPVSSPLNVDQSRPPAPAPLVSTPDQIRAHDAEEMNSSTIQRSLENETGFIEQREYDPEGLVANADYSLGNGYNARRTSNNDGWQIISPRGDILNETADSDYLNRMDLLVANADHETHLDRARRISTTDAFAPSGGRDLSGDTDEAIDPEHLRNSVRQALDTLDANPNLGSGVQFALPGGYRLSRNGDGSYTLNHQDPNVVGEPIQITRAQLDQALSNGSDAMSSWIHRGVHERERRSRAGQAAAYPNQSTETAQGQISRFVESLSSLNNPSEVFQPNQPFGAGNLIIRRNSNNNGWTIEDRIGRRVIDFTDIQLSQHDDRTIRTALNRYQLDYAPPPPTPRQRRQRDTASSESTDNPVTIVDSEPWTEGSGVRADHLMGEMSTLLEPNRGNYPDEAFDVELLGGRYRVTGDGNGNIKLVDADGNTVQDGIQTAGGRYYTHNVRSLADQINISEARRLANVPLGPTPHEVWGAPDGDGAEVRPGARVRIAATGEMGTVTSLTPNGNSARITTDDGNTTTRRVSGLTAFGSPDVDANGNPVGIVGLSRANVAAMRNIPGADKLGQWLRMSKAGALTDADNREIKRVLQNIQDATEMESMIGYRTKIRAVGNGYGGISVEQIYYDSNGYQVGNASYSIKLNDDNTISAYHGYMSINRDHQNKGISAISNSAIQNWYRFNGVHAVRTQANIDGGTYAWSRLGFGWDDQHFDYGNVRRLMRYAEDASNNYPDFQDSERQKMQGWKDALDRMERERGHRNLTVADFENYGIPSPGDIARYGEDTPFEITGPDGRVHKSHAGKDGLRGDGKSYYAMAILDNMPFDDAPAPRDTGEQIPNRPPVTPPEPEVTPDVTPVEPGAPDAGGEAPTGEAPAAGGAGGGGGI